MSNKVFLIAKREWLENVRTKAFWIGVLIVPIIFAASIVVPRLVDSAKSARTYVVVDQSGWLLEAVDQLALQQDMMVLLSQEPDKDKSIQSHIDQIRAQLPDDPQQRNLNLSLIAGAIAFDQPANRISPELTQLVNQHRSEIKQWWTQLDPEAANKVNRGLSKARFKRLESSDTDPASLNKQVADQTLFAYFQVDGDPVKLEASHRYVSSNLTDDDLSDWFTALADSAIRNKRIDARGVDAETAALLQQKLRFVPIKISESGEEETVDRTDRIRQFGPIGFVYVLWISIFSITQMLLNSTVEEKSNRLMEVLLSSVSPFQLMMGKIFGIAATGLTTILAWLVSLFAVSKIVPKFLGAGGLDLSSILTDPVFISSFIVYFILGFLFYAAIIGAIGSVCSTLKEAQALQAPVTMFMILPLLLMTPVARDPDGLLAQVLSYFPPMTPFVMMNRAAGNPSLFEYIVTTILLVVSVIAMIWAGAKVFRVGVLMTGKAPSFSEMIRLIRAPVGNQQVRQNNSE